MHPRSPLLLQTTINNMTGHGQNRVVYDEAFDVIRVIIDESWDPLVGIPKKETGRTLLDGSLLFHVLLFGMTTYEKLDWRQKIMRKFRYTNIFNILHSMCQNHPANAQCALDLHIVERLRGSYTIETPSDWAIEGPWRAQLARITTLSGIESVALPAPRALDAPAVPPALP